MTTCLGRNGYCIAAAGADGLCPACRKNAGRRRRPRTAPGKTVARVVRAASPGLPGVLEGPTGVAMHLPGVPGGPARAADPERGVDLVDRVLTHAAWRSLLRAVKDLAPEGLRVALVCGYCLAKIEPVEDAAGRPRLVCRCSARRVLTTSTRAADPVFATTTERLAPPEAGS